MVTLLSAACCLLDSFQALLTFNTHVSRQVCNKVLSDVYRGGSHLDRRQGNLGGSVRVRAPARGSAAVSFPLLLPQPTRSRLRFWVLLEAGSDHGPVLPLLIGAVSHLLLFSQRARFCFQIRGLCRS